MTCNPLRGKAPRTADVVLYLDLDGVLHHEEVYFHPKRGPFVHQGYAPGHTLFEWAHLLQDLLAPFPDVALVLSSSWCVQPGYGKTIKRLPPELRRRFIGGTFHRRAHGADSWAIRAFKEMPRGLQIWADVVRRKPGQWLALDDDAFGWPAWARENLVECDGAKGLSCPETREQLTAKLAALSA